MRLKVLRLFPLCGIALTAYSLAQSTTPSSPQIPTSTTTSAPAPLDAKWTDLLTRLAAEDFKTRSAAQKELEKLPYTDRPFLERLAAQTSDAEVKSSLTARVEEMEEQLALNPPPLSLDVKDMPLREVFEQLSKQTGLKVRGWPDWGNQPNQPLDKHITIKLENQPIWAAIRQISLQQPMGPMNLQENANVQVQLGNDGMNGPGVSCGPALITLNSLLRQYRVTLGDKPEDAKIQNSFDANFMLMIDPRVRIAYAPNAGNLSIAQALDDKGNSLLPLDGKSTTQVWWQNGGYSNCNLPLRHPDNPGTRITVLKGTLTYTAEVQSRQIDLTLPKAGPEVSHLEGMVITFKKFTAKNNQATINIKISRGTMAAETWKNIIPMHSNHTMRCELLDAGNAAARSNGWGGSSDDNMIDYEYNYSLNDRPGSKFIPAKFRITVPTKIKEVAAPFEFKGIPLP